MKLSLRLRGLCSMIPCGTAVFDVGCDHAYVPIALVQEGISPFCIASDIRPGPLSAAGEHIREAGLADRITLVLADGVPRDAVSLLEAGRSCSRRNPAGPQYEDSSPASAVTLLTAGMGGLMMLDILAKANVPRGFFTYYLASPQRDADLFRTGLAAAGYRITDETIVEEYGKYYPLILSEYVGTSAEPLTKEQAFLGPVLMEKGGDVYRKFLSEKIRTCEDILNALPEDKFTRREQIQTELQILRDAAIHTGIIAKERES